MTTDRKYKDVALREALQQEMATKPHFQLADGWQDNVIRQVRPMSRRLIWTAAAVIAVLLIGSVIVIWNNEKGNKFQNIDVCHQEAGVPQVETPIVITQEVPTQTELSSAAKKPKLIRKKHTRILIQSRQDATEIAETSTPSSLSANRDRMRQALMEKMNRHSDMSDFEPEIHDKI